MHAYGEKLRSGMTAARFMVIRLIRLYPLYALGTVIGISVVGAGVLLAHVPTAQSPADAALAMLMLPSTKAGYLYPFNSPGWSLAFELIGNLVFAAVLAGLSLKAQRAAAIAVLGASAVGITATALANRGIGTGYDWSSAWGGLFHVGCSFTLGIILYRLPRPNWSAPPSLMVVALALMLSVGFPAGWNMVYQLACIFAGFPLLVLISANSRLGPQGERIAGLLGRTSYGVYVLHKPLYWALTAAATRIIHLPLDRTMPWAGFAFVFVLIGIVAHIDRHFDAPLRRRLYTAVAYRRSFVDTPAHATNRVGG